MFVIKIGAKGISKDILETVNANTNDNNLTKWKIQKNIQFTLEKIVLKLTKKIKI